MSTIPKLALIPSGVKASKVYSVLPSNGVGDFDFSRSGDATRINKDGLIETVDSNIPRLNYPLIDGVVSGCPSLLLEPQSTNLIEYSEDFSNAYWIKLRLSVVLNSIISPNGSLNASKIIEDTSNGTHILYRNNINTGSGESSLSIYVKPNGRNWVYIYDSENGNGAYFDVQNGLIGTIIGTPTSYEIKEVANGFYRISIVSTSITLVDYQVYLAENDGVNSYQGDGVSGVYVFGSQLEFNDFPTSYIPNYGTALGVTRSAETCNNAGNVNTFNDSEGVLFAEIKLIPKNTTSSRITISDGTSGNRIAIEDDEDLNTLKVLSNGSGGSTTTMLNITDASLFGVFIKIAIQYNGSQGKVYINGIERSASTGMDSKIGLDNLRFESTAGALPFYGNTKQIQYFDTALNDTSLEELTSWTSFNEMARELLYTIL